MTIPTHVLYDHFYIGTIVEKKGVKGWPADGHVMKYLAERTNKSKVSTAFNDNVKIAFKYSLLLHPTPC